MNDQLPNKIVSYINRNRSGDFIGIRCSYCKRDAKAILVKSTSMVVPLCKNDIEPYFKIAIPVYNKLKKNDILIRIKNNNGRINNKTIKDF